ncbi:hypothetical protein SAMN05519103_08685 [Rhizobiales bacterium GAS113]|nr:hypothetical protein SAMN05519103_08685 [Rhizobiales bacterium GAS113]
MQPIDLFGNCLRSIAWWTSACGQSETRTLAARIGITPGPAQLDAAHIWPSRGGRVTK